MFVEHDGEEGADVEFRVRTKFILKQFYNFSETILIRVAHKGIQGYGECNTKYLEV